MFTPFGNMMRLPDGRMLVKNANGAWIDQMTGSQYNPQTMRDMMYSANFDVPDGGRGKKTPMWVIGVAGAVTITNWLNDVKNRVDSLDMVFVGDSNIAYAYTAGGDGFQNQGLVDNFLLAGICSGMINYGSPLFSVGGDAIQPYNLAGYKNYNVGWRTNANLGWTNGNKFGPSVFKNEYGISLGQFSTNGLTLGFAGYSWLPNGVTGCSDLGASWYLGTTGGQTGLNAGLSLTARFIIGATLTGGSIRLLGYDSTGGRYIGDGPTDTLVISYTNGFTAYEKDITKSGGIGNTAMNYYFGGLQSSGFYCTGPIAFAAYSVYNPVKGLATHSLQHSPGLSLGAIYNNTVLAGPAADNNTTVNYLKEYYNRQKAAGGSGRICIVIEGGVNLDTSSTATVDYIKNTVTLLTSEWARAGLPSDKLTFLCLNTWENVSTSTWTINLPSIVDSMNAYARGTSNVTYVNILKFGGTYAGLTAGGYYQPGEATHLTNAGYKYVSQNIMDALLKSGRNTFRG